MAKLSKEQLYGLIEKGYITFTGLLDKNGEVIDEKYLDTEYLLSNGLITHIHLENIPIGSKPNNNGGGKNPQENPGNKNPQNESEKPVNKVESTEESEESMPVSKEIKVEESEDDKLKPGVIKEREEK